LTLLTIYPQRYNRPHKRIDLSDLNVGDEAAVFAQVKR